MTDPGLHFARLRALFQCSLPNGRKLDIALVRMFTPSRCKPQTRWAGCQIRDESEEFTFLSMEHVLDTSIKLDQANSDFPTWSFYASSNAKIRRFICGRVLNSIASSDSTLPTQRGAAEGHLNRQYGFFLLPSTAQGLTHCANTGQNPYICPDYDALVIVLVILHGGISKIHGQELVSDSAVEASSRDWWWWWWLFWLSPKMVTTACTAVQNTASSRE
ncbi:hypothetical protein R3P38DRAFT_2810678 [Favolaschia claudopus]|uniref:Uncharacterized protein n=1 Tax=Favolaschia claudopus TaxID=2862362 RepID=A0AAV9Z9Z4_9AGAR